MGKYGTYIHMQCYGNSIRHDHYYILTSWVFFCVRMWILYSYTFQRLKQLRTFSAILYNLHAHKPLHLNLHSQTHHTHVHMQAHTRIHTYTHTHVHTYTHRWIHITYTHVHTHMHICTHTHAHTQMHASHMLLRKTCTKYSIFFAQNIMQESY